MVSVSPFHVLTDTGWEKRFFCLMVEKCR